MNKAIIRLILASVLLLPLSVQAEELVKEFRGSRDTNTLEFEVQDPWLLDWRVSGDASDIAAVDVSLFAAGTDIHEGVVLRTKYPGNGVRLMNQSGRFYFRVDVTALEWTLKVIQLTKKEAEAYTPVSTHILDQ